MTDFFISLYFYNDSFIYVLFLQVLKQNISKTRFFIKL